MALQKYLMRERTVLTVTFDHTLHCIMASFTCAVAPQAKLVSMFNLVDICTDCLLNNFLNYVWHRRRNWGRGAVAPTKYKALGHSPHNCPDSDTASPLY